MFEISMTTLGATVFEPSSFESADKFSDFRRHLEMVPLRYHCVKAANDQAEPRATMFQI